MNKIKEIYGVPLTSSPAAVDTLLAHFEDFNVSPSHYDLIVTGDLGSCGKKILCEYIRRNGLVARIEFDSDADMLPITVYYYQYPTDSELIERDMIFGVIYCLEVIGTLLVYSRKRKKTF